jgi:hypothetical protein
MSESTHDHASPSLDAGDLGTAASEHAGVVTNGNASGTAGAAANGGDRPSHTNVNGANGNRPNGNGANGNGANGNGANGNGEVRHGVTGAQLRRFIKSRPYVPLHELRRRFELNGEADDVWPIRTPDGVVYLGLPERESELLGELVRQGEVGLELCQDPRAPMVVGVFAMRPISRP